MNQSLKRFVYRRGSVKQAEFLAELGGMNTDETSVFLMLHDGKDDQYIQDMLCISRSAYELIEESVRAKLLLAVFECINYTRDNM